MIPMRYIFAYLALHLIVQFCPLKASYQMTSLARQVTMCDTAARDIFGRLDPEDLRSHGQLATLMSIHGPEAIQAPDGYRRADFFFFPRNNPELTMPFNALQGNINNLAQQAKNINLRIVSQDSAPLGSSRNMPNGPFGEPLASVYNRKIAWLSRSMPLARQRVAQSVADAGEEMFHRN